MELTTRALNDKLQKAENLGDFLESNHENMLDLTLSEYLTMLLRQKKLKRAEVIRGSGLEKAYVYQIFNGEKRPSRDKLIAIAFGLRLNAEETQRTLKLGGCSELYPRIARDAAILFSIQHGVDIWEADKLLHDNGLPTLHD